MTSRAPWLSHYDPGVPPSLEPYPSRTLLDFELARAIDDGELCLALTNLTDRSARDSWNYPLPGREINLTWRSKL